MHLFATVLFFNNCNLTLALIKSRHVHTIMLLWKVLGWSKLWLNSVPFLPVKWDHRPIVALACFACFVEDLRITLISGAVQHFSKTVRTQVSNSWHHIAFTWCFMTFFPLWNWGGRGLCVTHMACKPSVWHPCC